MAPRRVGTRLVGALSVAAAVLLLGVGLPTLAQAHWADVYGALGVLTWHQGLALTGLWFCGLFAHTFVLTAALPRLSHRRALAMSLTGSAVSNVVPFGGALGVGLNRHMTKTWGYSASSFALYTIVTNLWDVLLKLVLPAAALGGMLLAGEVVGHQLRVAAVVAVLLLAGLVALVGLALGSVLVTVALARATGWLLETGARVVRREIQTDPVAVALHLRTECLTLVRRNWARLSLGMLSYAALQALLLGLCLQLVGARLTPTEVFAGYALERLLTLVPITPGGSGLVEVGISGLLVAFGGDPVLVVAGVVLYRAFTFGLEIPVGALGLALWVAGRRRQGARLRAPLTRAAGDGPLRIAHVTDVYLPRLGGIELHVSDLAAQQRGRGHDVHILTSTPGATEPGVIRLAPWASGHLLRKVSSARAAHRVLASGDYDVVHVHASVWSPFATLVARGASQVGLPTVVTVHSMWSRLGPIPRLFAAALRLASWPVAWTAVSATAALSVASAVGVPVGTLTNGIDPADWTVADAPSEVPTVISVMRLARRKRPLALLALMRRVRHRLDPHQPMRLVIVGDGPLLRRARSYVRRHGMQDWVELAGRLDREQIRARYATAAVYVAPAELESFGLAALEARCAGLPVVASSRGGVGEFVRPGLEGLLADDDRGLAAAIAQLVIDDATRRRMAAHNRTVPPAVVWPAVLERTDAMYDVALELAARHRVEVLEPVSAAPLGALA